MKVENRKLNRLASENDKQNKKRFAIEAEAFNSPEHTLSRLESDRRGLYVDDARERLFAYGRNEVAHDRIIALTFFVIGLLVLLGGIWLIFESPGGMHA